MVLILAGLPSDYSDWSGSEGIQVKLKAFKQSQTKLCINLIQYFLFLFVLYCPLNRILQSMSFLHIVIIILNLTVDN